MALEMNTFLMVFAAAIVILGGFIWFKFRAAEKKNP
jgi:hypothetical protein